MRLLAAFLGILALAAGGVLLYASHSETRERELSAAGAIEQILGTHTKALEGRISTLLARADHDATAALTRWKRKSKVRGPQADALLAEPEAPKFVIAAGKALRAAGLAEEEALEAALGAVLGAERRLTFQAVGGKYYLFISGISGGEPYASLYEPAGFFSSLHTGDGIRVWVLLPDGSVIFHPQARFVGSNGANLRPVARGIQALAEGRAGIFTEKYIGLDGSTALGSWTPLPGLGLVVGSEWARAALPTPRSTALLVWSFVLASLGAAFFAGAIFRREPQHSKGHERLFDASHLDEDAMEYLEQVKTTADEAVLYAQDQERIAQEASRQRALVARQLRFLEWKNGLLEGMQDAFNPEPTGKQVWLKLMAMMTEKSPGLAVVAYRYSPSTFSLVPEHVATSVPLENHVLAYLGDARIFIGKRHLIDELTSTEAFSRWNKSRQRHMPVHDTDFRAFPLDAGPYSLMLVLFDRRMNPDGELEEALGLYADFIRRATSFCDSQQRLLQLRNAKGFPGQALASASDDAGSESRPS